MSKDSAALLDAETDPETDAYRLPRTVVPTKYEIVLEPDLVNFTFKGDEAVDITVAQPTDQILLNAVDLRIEEAKVKNARGQQLEAVVSFDASNERVQFKFKEKLASGSWKLHIKFKGEINDRLHGFYRSSYQNSEGITRVIATTQFEATDARRAFPCWDEPDFKAVFKVKLIIDEHLRAISNTKIRREILHPEKHKKEILFEQTIKMSSYLVAFIIGEFEATRPVNVANTPVQIWAVPGKLSLTKFSLGVAEKCLAFFNRYYGLKYAGDKLDLIAIPDFAYGGMENLGCITFRENALLVDEKSASHAELEHVADVVAHEIAHMWFGDLATMKWWNGLWLNEAFATFMEMLAVDALKPEWRRWESFGLSRSYAFFTDGLRSTRAIEYPVHRPEEAQAMFDAALTYAKGGAVLRMLEQYLGPEGFRRGVNLYLAKYKYSNAETSDLWDAIEESSKQPVREMMDSWIFQEGHPLISAELDKSGRKLKLHQQRFLYEAIGVEEKKSARDTLFHVPVLVRAKCGEESVVKKALLTTKSCEISFDEKVDYVVVNEGGHGFYRVRYSADLLSRLMQKKEKFLSATERFNLINDLWANVLAGLQPLNEYVSLIKCFTDEEDKNVWSVITSSLLYMEKVTGRSEGLKKLTGEVCRPAFDKLTWHAKKNESELTKQLRGLLAQILGTVGDDAKIQEEARTYYKKFKAHKSSVAPDLVPAIVSILAQTGDRARYEEFEAEYQKASNPQERERYMFGLAAFPSAELVKKTLAKTLNGEVRSQDAPGVLRAALTNVVARDASWQFLQENWAEIMRVFPEPSLPNAIDGITALVAKKSLQETRDFFKANPLRQGKKKVEQSLEKQAVAVSLLEREKKALASL
jgi:puromycin-sensitive aminopeptidase